MPYDFLVSGFVTISSGLGFNIADASQGFGFGHSRSCSTRPAGSRLAFRTVDFRLEKIFRFGDQQRVSLAGEAFNIFNYTNDAGYEGFIPPLPEVNPNFG